MATNKPNPRGDLDRDIQNLVGPGREPKLYTRSVMTVNSLLQSQGVPLPKGFDTVVKHNVNLVQSGQISSTSAHLNEVGPLVQGGIDYYKSGNYKQSAICLGGALGNMGASMLSASNQASAMKIGKDEL